MRNREKKKIERPLSIVCSPRFWFPKVVSCVAFRRLSGSAPIWAEKCGPSCDRWRLPMLKRGRVEREKERRKVRQVSSSSFFLGLFEARTHPFRGFFLPPKPLDSTPFFYLVDDKGARGRGLAGTSICAGGWRRCCFCEWKRVFAAAAALAAVVAARRGVRHRGLARLLSLAGSLFDPLLHSPGVERE